ncbi:MAG: porin [Pseudomonadota bacterium]
MIKKILPTMIGAALAGGMTAAAADVAIFGHIDEALLYSDVSPNTATPGFDGKDTNLVCTTCSIGFKGSEDLGNGLSAIFSLDFQYDINNRNQASSGTNSVLDRDQWVGLAGGFGKVRVGTISTGYKSHGAMLDPGYRTVAQMRDHGIQSSLHSGAGEEGQGRATNTFRWDSPDYSGFKAVVTYTVDSNEGDGEDNNPWGVGGSYENGGILVFADYLTNGRGGDDDAWKVGGKYSMNNFAVFAQYESDGGLISQSENGFVSNNTINGADVWMVGGSATFGSNTVYAAYGQGDDDNNPSFDSGYDAWELVGVHSMSKNTLAYAGYVNKNEDDPTGVERQHFTVGMKHKF